MIELTRPELGKNDRSIVEGKVVSASQTQAGFAVGVQIRSSVHYFFHNTYIHPGTKVHIKIPEGQLLQKST